MYKLNMTEESTANIKNQFDDNELLFTTSSNDSIMGGGFKINSSMLKDGISPMSTVNNKIGGEGRGGKVSDIFHHLAVPSFFHMKSATKGGTNKNRVENYSDEMLSENIHNHFLDLMAVPILKRSSSLHHSRKKIHTIGKKHTRKNM
jgi:hypothetical protein